MKYFIILLISFSLIACSGGGGGSGGAASTGVRVIHAAIDAAPVDLVFGTEFLQRYEFAGDAFRVRVAEGDQVLSLTVARTPTSLVFSVPLTVDSTTRKTILFHGDLESFGLRNTVLDDALPEIPEQSIVIRLVHGVTGALSLSATINDDITIPSVSFGESSEYLVIPEGPSVFSVKRVADGLVLASGESTFVAGNSYTIAVVGEAEYFTRAKVYRD